MTYLYPVPAQYEGAICQGFGENPAVYARFIVNGKPLAGHNGLDFAVPEGTDVLASKAGVVVKAGPDSTGYGNFIKLLHNDGDHTLYAHLSRILAARIGQRVDAHEVIGKSGNTGFSDFPHLHYEIRPKDGGVPGYNGCVNPRPLLTPSSVADTIYPPQAEEPLPELDAVEELLAMEPIGKLRLVGEVRCRTTPLVTEGNWYGHTLPDGIMVAYYGTTLDPAGNTWAQIGRNRWIAQVHSGFTYAEVVA